MIVLYVCFVFSLYFLYNYTKYSKVQNLPPGTFGWPIIGSFPKFNVPFLEQIEENRKKYGNTFLWRIGSRNIIFLCDPKTIKKAFNNPHLINRPQNHFTFDSGSFYKKIGIANSNGLHWQTHRRFVLHHLRDSGFGKSSLEGVVQLEAEALVEDVRMHHLNKTVSIPHSIYLATLNVIAKLSTGMRFSLEDKRSQELLEAISKYIQQIQGLINIFDIFPWLVPITPTFVFNLIGLKKQMNNIDYIHDFVQSVIDERKKKLDADHPDGLIDSYLIEMGKSKEEENLYSELALVMSLGDLFIAGSDTTAITTEWILQYITCYPDIQQKLQEEIDTVVPRDRYPSFTDRPNMPYTEAVIHEGLRISSLAALGLFHEASQDTNIDGYCIPQGTVICAFLYGCHTNGEYWERPFEFRPERFIDSDGKFKMKNEAFLPFASGTFGWPILGSLPKFNVPFPEQIEENRRKYGNTFLWRIGSRNIVFLCDPRTVKKAFNNPHLINRPQDYFTFDFGSFYKKIGIVNSNGLHWQTHRRLVLHHLKDSGFGKSSLEGVVQLEAEALVENVRIHHLNKIVSIPRSIYLATLNTIAKLSTGIRFSLEERRSEELLGAFSNYLRQLQGLINIFDIFPWLVPITPTFVFNVIGLKKQMNNIKCIQDFVQSVIDERKTKLNVDNPDGLIDSYLVQINKSNNEENVYSEKALVVSVTDLFIAGSDTTAVTTEWILQYITCFPDIQKKLQEEIDAVVPRNRYPGFADRPNLPYTEAVVHEGLRISSIASVGLLHEASQDTNIDGYCIPRGTSVCAFLYGCHKNEKYWEKPLEFRPERFIDSDGKFKLKNEAFLPFGIGRRICIGESLAKTQLFMYLSALAQNFTFSIPDGGKQVVERSPESVTLMAPSDLKMVIKER